MIRILTENHRNFFTLELKGHSGQGTRGNDPVCAAVSSAVFNFLLYVENRCEASFQEKTIEPKKPLFRAVFSIKKGHEEFMIVYDYFLYNIDILKSRYPDHIEWVGLVT